MRILVTTSPAVGHFFPMVAFMWALRCAGHHVLVAGPRAIANEARNAGLASAVVGDVSPRDIWTEIVEPTEGLIAECGATIAERSAVDLAKLTEAAIKEFGVTIAERLVDDLVKLCESWSPDLVVSEPLDFTGAIVANLHSAPLVTHRWGLQYPDHFISDLIAPLRPRLIALFSRFGLDFDSCSSSTIIDNCPSSLRRAESGSWISMRYVPYCGTGIMPAWLFERRSRPRICVSMGSVPLKAGVDGLRLAADALADLDADIVVSGAGSRGSSLGSLPANAHAVGWLPHEQLLPTCDVIVHHGGAGSAMVSLINGLPQLILPQMGDQFLNADQLVQRGVAEKVDLPDRSPGPVRRGVEALLAESSYRRNAAEVRTEIASMRSPLAAVADIERIAESWSNGY